MRTENNKKSNGFQKTSYLIRKSDKEQPPRFKYLLKHAHVQITQTFPQTFAQHNTKTMFLHCILFYKSFFLSWDASKTPTEANSSTSSSQY